MEQQPKPSYSAAAFDFSALGRRWRFVESFEREGVRYLVVSEDTTHPSLLALTRRERQIVAEAAAGSSNQQIAQHLGISHATVRVLMARAANRFGVHTRKALLAHPALHGQGVKDAQAGPVTPLVESSGFELAEQAVSFSGRTGTEE